MPFFTKVNLRNNQSLFCEELKVKHLKSIYKCLLGDEPDTELLFYNLHNIIKSLTRSDLNEIDFLDYFILLIEIRCSCIGSVINIQISENTNFEINLYKFIETLKNINLNDFLKPEHFDDIAVYFKLPKIYEIVQFNTELETIYSYFIKEVQIKDLKYSFKSPKETEDFLKHLPAKYFSTITQKINDLVSYFNNVNLLGYNENLIKSNIILPFNFNIKNLFGVVKILFGNHLMPLYENILALCKINNFTPEYIENCTPGEYLLFIKKLEEMNFQKQQQQPYTEEQNEFAEQSFNPYDSGDLPPITSEFTG